MSDLRTLRELAELAAQTAPARGPHVPAAGVADTIATAAEMRPARPRVAELLGKVMSLSARNRRSDRAPVEIDLDVFTPAGERAVRLYI